MILLAIISIANQNLIPYTNKQSVEIRGRGIVGTLNPSESCRLVEGSGEFVLNWPWSSALNPCKRGSRRCRDLTVTAGGYKIIKFDPYLKRGHISFRQEIWIRVVPRGTITSSSSLRKWRWRAFFIAAISPYSKFLFFGKDATSMKNVNKYTRQ